MNYITEQDSNSILIAGEQRAVHICVSEYESSAVQKAVCSMQKDIMAVCGLTPLVVSDIVLDTMVSDYVIDTIASDNVIDTIASDNVIDTIASDAIITESSANSFQIIVGTIGQSTFIDKLIAKGILNTDSLRIQEDATKELGAVKESDAAENVEYNLNDSLNHDSSDGFDERNKDKGSKDKRSKDKRNYKWEGYILQVVNQNLIIAGTDRRGTIYGIYDFCEAIGVSPWYFFADVPVKQKKEIWITKDLKKTDWPSVQYRGIFINDEEELEAWAIQYKKESTIGPKTYADIFELLLRLKANYIWPAMHVNSFNMTPENGRLAEEFGIVVGTSHCDMLLRSNQNEWQPWIRKKGYTDAVYDYSIPGRNREIIQEYWSESVKQNKDYEVCFTVGMRGIHDSGFITEAIDHNDTLSAEEKKAAKVDLLAQVIKGQRNIIKEIKNNLKEICESRNGQLQTFVPYKEVLSLYDSGLELPEDITLMWVDDNFGYIRRYPDAKEQSRSGGNGLYYHSSYWAHPGMSYLFINSIPLAHTKNELKKAYESGIQKIWVQNVGAIKPLEQDIEFFMTYAWEAGKEKLTSDVSIFTEDWCNRNFSGNQGRKVAEIYNTYAQITNVCKVEHMTSDKFSQTAYGDEGARRLERFEDIYNRGNEIWRYLPKEERSAFFQMILMKIHAAYYINHTFYYADRSKLCFEHGKMQAADCYLNLERKFDDYKREMLYYYNEKMCDGKWKDILTPESFPPPATALYPAAKPALTIGDAGLGVIVYNQETSEGELFIEFAQFGQTSKWFELFNTGAGSVAFTIQADDWISLSEKHGTIETEKRIWVTIEGLQEHAGREGYITVNDINREIKTRVLVRVDALIEEQVQDERHVELDGYHLEIEGCHVEADGYLSVLADHYNNENSEVVNGWKIIEHMGRYEGNAVEVQSNIDTVEVHNKDIDESQSNQKDIQGSTAMDLQQSVLEYDLFFVSSGMFLFELYRFPTLNSTGRIRIGVGIDDFEPITLETCMIDEWLGEWRDAVMNNVDKMYLQLPELTAGRHTLKLYPIDAYFTFSKFVIYTKGFRKTNLGPEESYHSIYNAKIDNLGCNADVCSRIIKSYHNGIKEEKCIHKPDNRILEPDLKLLEKVTNRIYGTIQEEVPLPPVVYAGKEYWSKNRLFLRTEKYPQERLGAPNNYCTCNNRKDVIKQFGQGIFLEQDGFVALEAEYALENTANAYITDACVMREHGNVISEHDKVISEHDKVISEHDKVISEYDNGIRENASDVRKYDTVMKNPVAATWSHTQSETAGRTGLAMHVETPNLHWENAKEAPAMHYKIAFTNNGYYYVWLLLKYDDEFSDACFLGLDGRVQSAADQFSKGHLFNYGTKQIWCWMLISQLDIMEGIHTFSIHAGKSRLRIDRIYLTTKEMNPPEDDKWVVSERKYE